MKKNITPSTESRLFLRQNKNAILSTISVDVAGFPFGSVCPYILDHQGRPVILISTIAQHTKNIINDQRVCLTVMDERKANRLEGARVSMMGKARLLTSAKLIESHNSESGGRDTDYNSVSLLLRKSVVDEKDLSDVSARFLRFFPESRFFFNAHDFNYYTIDPLRVRYIEGFAKIYWVDQEKFLLKETELAKSETDIINHMNKDHLDALKKYYESKTGQIPKTIEMIAIDPEGFNLRSDSRDEYIRFESPCTTPQDVRNQMIHLLKQHSQNPLPTSQPRKSYESTAHT